MPDIYDLIDRIEAINIKVDYTNAPLTFQNLSKFHTEVNQNLNNKITQDLKLYTITLTRNVVNVVVNDNIVIHMTAKTSSLIQSIRKYNDYNSINKQSVLNSFKTKYP